MPDFAIYSILPLYWCILVGLSWNRAVLLHVLLACLAMPIAATVMLSAVSFATPRLQHVLDPALIGLDGSFGVQPAALVAGLFSACVPVKDICTLVYAFLTATIALSAGMELRSGKIQGIGVLPTFLFAGVLGYALYFLMPAVGPAPYLGTDFASLLYAPDKVAGRIDFSAIPRNCVPSMHTAWAALAYLALRSQPAPIRWVSFAFLILTMLATLGLGHHYLVDLVVAAPFVLVVRSVCAVQIAWRPERLIGAGAGLLFLAIWCVAIRGWLPTRPMMLAAPATMLITIALSVWCEHRLARAELRHKIRTKRKASGFMEARVFFSEEKNQKTFALAPADSCRPWPERWETAEK